MKMSEYPQGMTGCNGCENCTCKKEPCEAEVRPVQETAPIDIIIDRACARAKENNEKIARQVPEGVWFKHIEMKDIYPWLQGSLCIAFKEYKDTDIPRSIAFGASFRSPQDRQFKRKGRIIALQRLSQVLTWMQTGLGDFNPPAGVVSVEKASKGLKSSEALAKALQFLYLDGTVPSWAKDNFQQVVGEYLNQYIQKKQNADFERQTKARKRERKA